MCGVSMEKETGGGLSREGRGANSQPCPSPTGSVRTQGLFVSSQPHQSSNLSQSRKSVDILDFIQEARFTPATRSRECGRKNAAKYRQNPRDTEWQSHRTATAAAEKWDVCAHRGEAKPSLAVGWSDA